MNSQFPLSDDVQGPNDATSYLDFEQLRKKLVEPSQDHWRTRRFLHLAHHIRLHYSM